MASSSFGSEQEQEQSELAGDRRSSDGIRPDEELQTAFRRRQGYWHPVPSAAPQNSRRTRSFAGEAAGMKYCMWRAASAMAKTKPETNSTIWESAIMCGYFRLASIFSAWMGSATGM